MGLNKYFYKAKTDSRYNDIYGGRKWVIGSLIITECMSNPVYVHSPDECDCDVYQIRQTEGTFADWNMPFEYKDYYIDKNTICQYSEREDSYGTPIFENDLLRINGTIYKVVKDGDFFVRDKNGQASEYLCNALVKRKVEVISNYFDDGELLG